jgi:hypothetical protein
VQVPFLASAFVREFSLVVLHAAGLELQDIGWYLDHAFLPIAGCRH